MTKMLHLMLKLKMSYVTIVSINLLPSEVAKICSQDINNEENATQIKEIKNELYDKQSLTLRNHKKPVHKDIKNEFTNF